MKTYVAALAVTGGPSDKDGEGNHATLLGNLPGQLDRNSRELKSVRFADYPKGTPVVVEFRVHSDSDRRDILMVQEADALAISRTLMAWSAELIGALR